MNKLEGKLNGQGLKIGIVVGRFNDFISGKLLEGSLDCLIRHDVADSDIDVAWVPGAFEIPLLAKKMASTKKYDAIITLGAVIRGSTPHFDYVCKECSSGVAKVALETEVPVIFGVLFGVLTTDSIEQAIERAGTKAGNKGWEVSLGAIEMASLMRKFE